MPPFNQQYIRPPYLGGGPNEAPMPQRAIPSQPMQPMAPQMPPPPLPPMPSQIPPGVNPQMLPRPQGVLPPMNPNLGGGQYGQNPAMRTPMAPLPPQMMSDPSDTLLRMRREMEAAERLEMLEKSIQQKRIRGMLGE